jgi:hypothetical protein
MNNEPVAWLLQTKTAHQFTFKEPTTAPQGVFPIPLYTHPSEHDLEIAEAIGFDKGYKAATAKTLTDEEIKQINQDEGTCWDVPDRFAIQIARAILKKASEK